MKQGLKLSPFTILDIAYSLLIFIDDQGNPGKLGVGIKGLLILKSRYLSKLIYSVFIVYLLVLPVPPSSQLTSSYYDGKPEMGNFEVVNMNNNFICHGEVHYFGWCQIVD